MKNGKKIEHDSTELIKDYINEGNIGKTILVIDPEDKLNSVDFIDLNPNNFNNLNFIN